MVVVRSSVGLCFSKSKMLKYLVKLGLLLRYTVLNKKLSCPK